MKGGQLPGVRAGHSLCVDIVTHLFTSMVNACSHIYLYENKRSKMKQKKKKKHKEKKRYIFITLLRHCSETTYLRGTQLITANSS